MKLYQKCRNIIVPCIVLVSLFLVVGCSSFSDTSHASNASSTNPSSERHTVFPTVISNAKVGTNKPGIGPVTIQSPTAVPGGSTSSQQVDLADRTLVIDNVSRQVNLTSHMTTVTIKVTIKNTSHKDIKNLATYYQIIGVEGDMFGLPPDAGGNFFGMIASNSTSSGTLVFQQIPSAAIKKLQLLYRSETAQTIFVPLNA